MKRISPKASSSASSNKPRAPSRTWMLRCKYHSGCAHTRRNARLYITSSLFCRSPCSVSLHHSAYLLLRSLPDLTLASQLTIFPGSSISQSERRSPEASIRRTLLKRFVSDARSYESERMLREDPTLRQRQRRGGQPGHAQQ